MQQVFTTQFNISGHYKATVTFTPVAPVDPIQSKERSAHWRAEEALYNICDMGASLGALAAEFWHASRTTERFRYSSITAYRDATMNDCIAQLKEQRYASEFRNGYIMGFEDEALMRAEAGDKVFADVAVAGSVNGAASVMAERVLRLAEAAGLELH